MKSIKKGTTDELVSVIRELQERIRTLEETVRASHADYSQVVEILKPAIVDLVDARDGQRVASDKQLSQSNGMYLLEITGALKGMRATYGGKEDSEMARVLELVVGFNSEQYRKMLGQGELSLNPLDRESAETAQTQLLKHLEENGCSKTAKMMKKT